MDKFKEVDFETSFTVVCPKELEDGVLYQEIQRAIAEAMRSLPLGVTTLMPFIAIKAPA